MTATKGRVSAMGYEERCAAAAREQGLMPALAALRAEGIACSLEQTGGFCMLVGVYRPDNDYLWISAQEGYDGGEGWLVCTYDGASGDERSCEQRCALSDLAGMARDFLA